MSMATREQRHKQSFQYLATGYIGMAGYNDLGYTKMVSPIGTRQQIIQEVLAGWQAGQVSYWKRPLFRRGHELLTRNFRFRFMQHLFRSNALVHWRGVARVLHRLR